MFIGMNIGVVIGLCGSCSLFVWVLEWLYLVISCMICGVDFMEEGLVVVVILVVGIMWVVKYFGWCYIGFGYVMCVVGRSFGRVFEGLW